MATSKARLSNSKDDQYMKNLFKSLKVTSLNVVRDIAPNISSTVSENVDFVKRSYTTIKSKAGSGKLKKTVTDILNNAKQELKSGKFYSDDDMLSGLDNIDFSDDMSDDEFFNNFDDSGSSTDYFNEDGKSTTINNNTKNTKNVFIKSDNKTSVKAFSVLSESMIKTNMNGFSTINNTLTDILEFHNQNTQGFYTDVSEKLTTIAEKLNDMAKLTAGSTQLNMATSKSITSNFDKVLDNTFRLEDYFKDAKESLSLFTTMMSMGDMFSDGQSFKKNPIGWAAKTGIKALIPKNIKAGIKGMDDYVGMLPYIFNNTLQGWSKKGGLKGGVGMLAEMLGITKDTSYKKGLSLGEKNSAISFDSHTKKAITVVIPTYLSKILSALNKQPEIIYDFETGRFDNKKDIRKSFDKAEEYQLSGRNSDGIEKFMKAMEKDRELSNQEREQFFSLIAKLNKDNVNLDSDIDFNSLISKYRTKDNENVFNLMANTHKTANKTLKHSLGSGMTEARKDATKWKAEQIENNPMLSTAYSTDLVGKAPHFDGIYAKEKEKAQMSKYQSMLGIDSNKGIRENLKNTWSSIKNGGNSNVTNIVDNTQPPNSQTFSGLQTNQSSFVNPLPNINPVSTAQNTNQTNFVNNLPEQQSFIGPSNDPTNMKILGALEEIKNNTEATTAVTENMRIDSLITAQGGTPDGTASGSFGDKVKKVKSSVKGFVNRHFKKKDPNKQSGVDKFFNKMAEDPAGFIEELGNKGAEKGKQAGLDFIDAFKLNMASGNGVLGSAKGAFKDNFLVKGTKKMLGKSFKRTKNNLKKLVKWDGNLKLAEELANREIERQGIDPNSQEAGYIKNNYIEAARKNSIGAKVNKFLKPFKRIGRGIRDRLKLLWDGDAQMANELANREIEERNLDPNSVEAIELKFKYLKYAKGFKSRIKNFVSTKIFKPLKNKIKGFLSKKIGIMSREEVMEMAHKLALENNLMPGSQQYADFVFSFVQKEGSFKNRVVNKVRTAAVNTISKIKDKITGKKTQPKSEAEIEEEYARKKFARKEAVDKIKSKLSNIKENLISKKTKTPEEIAAEREQRRQDMNDIKENLRQTLSDKYHKIREKSKLMGEQKRETIRTKETLSTEGKKSLMEISGTGKRETLKTMGEIAREKLRGVWDKAREGMKSVLSLIGSGIKAAATAVQAIPGLGTVLAIALGVAGVGLIGGLVASQMKNAQSGKSGGGGGNTGGLFKSSGGSAKKKEKEEKKKEEKREKEEKEGKGSVLGNLLGSIFNKKKEKKEGAGQGLGGSGPMKLLMMGPTGLMAGILLSGKNGNDSADKSKLNALGKTFTGISQSDAKKITDKSKDENKDKDNPTLATMKAEEFFTKLHNIIANHSGGGSGSYNPSNMGSGSSSGSSGDTKNTVWNFLKGKGLSDEQAAGIMGNIQQESNFNSSSLNSSSGAFGLFQWLGGRKTNLENYARSKGKDPSDVTTQLEYFWSEIENGGQYNTLDKLKATNSAGDAATSFEKSFERSGGSAMDKRINYANTIYSQYKGKGIINDSSTTTNSSVNTGTGWQRLVGNLSTAKISSPFSSQEAFRSKPHNGIDIAGGVDGKPFFAFDAGKVIDARNPTQGRGYVGSKDNGGWGGTVAIEHADGSISRYAHASSVNVRVGDLVQSGQALGIMGSTGSSTGPHLHFGIQKNGRWLNPMDITGGSSAGSGSSSGNNGIICCPEHSGENTSKIKYDIYDENGNKIGDSSNIKSAITQAINNGGIDENGNVLFNNDTLRALTSSQASVSGGGNVTSGITSSNPSSNSSTNDTSTANNGNGITNNTPSSTTPPSSSTINGSSVQNSYNFDELHKTLLDTLEYVKTISNNSDRIVDLTESINNFIKSIDKSSVGSNNTLSAILSKLSEISGKIVIPVKEEEGFSLNDDFLTPVFKGL